MLTVCCTNIVRSLLSVLFGYGLNGGECLCRLDVYTTIVLADMQELCCQLLVGLCNEVLVFLACGVWVLGHDLFVGQDGLGPPPGSLKGAGYGVQGGKDSHIIICR